MYSLEVLVALNNPADRAALQRELQELAKPIYIPSLAAKLDQPEPAGDAAPGMSTKEEVCDASDLKEIGPQNL